jgi:rubrerythrin
MSDTSRAVLDALRAAARAERAQAAYYRALAARAEAQTAAPELAERLNGLVADEQHHLSRLVARLLELGAPAAVEEPVVAAVDSAAWEADARGRERQEIERYSALLELDLDARTRSMIEGFLEAERHHEEQLGGKWMAARGDGC